MADQPAFNPAAAIKHIERGRGSFDYLQVKDRIRWFREQNPQARILSETLYLDPVVGYAACRCTVILPDGGEAQGLGSACRKDLEDKAARKAVQPDQVESYLEFADTAAAGRALARLGYGTEEALDEAGPVDSPHQRPPAEQPTVPRRDWQRPTDAPRPAAPSAGPGLVTDKQLKAIYAIARSARHLTVDEVDARCQEIYKRAPSELTKQEASQLIDKLQAEVAP